jgi:transposase
VLQRLDPPEHLVERMRAHLLTASPGTVAGKAFTGMLFVDQLELLNTQIRAVTERLRERLATHPDAAIFLSFPGMGQITAATMLAEMGEDRSRSPTAAALLAETGTAPVTRSSGRSRSVHFRYAANKRMRHAVDWWTFVAVRENAWAARPTSRPEPAATAQPPLRGVGARWTRILWRCWTDHTTYDPQRHFTSAAEATG